MQVGIRLHDAVDAPLEERLTKVKEQGFTCTHLALSKVIKEYPVTKEALTPGLAMHLKRLFAANQLDVAVLGCYLNLADPDPEALKGILETYKAHICFAGILGVGVVGTETGAPNTEYRYEPACRGEEAYQTLVKNLKEVVAYAEKMGVIFAIEPVLKHIIYDAKRARRLLDDIASPNLQIILDPVNLLGMENVDQREKVIREAIELLGDDVAVVHIKDFVIEENDLSALAAGKGQMNYEEIIRFIKQKKPFIQVTLENTKPENAVEAKKTLEDLWAQV